jgi:hypothetical protein
MLSWEHSTRVSNNVSDNVSKFLIKIRKRNNITYHDLKDSQQQMLFMMITKEWNHEKR